MRASLIGLTVLVAAASPALADNKTKAKAKALYDSGLQHYNLAEYPEAIKDWKEAYSLSKKPLLLFNIGQAYRLSGDCKMAGTFYDTYQREEPNPKNQDELDQALALCAKANEKPAEGKPTDFKPQDKPQDKPKDTKPISSVKVPVADPPDKKPETKPETKPAKGPEVSEAGDNEGDDHQVDTPEPSGTTGGGMRKIGYGVTGLGVVLGVVGIVSAKKSADKASELETYMGEWGPTQMALESDGQSAATRAWVFGGLGVAAIAAGTVLIVIGGPKQVEASSVSVVPTRGGAAVGYGFTF